MNSSDRVLVDMGSSGFEDSLHVQPEIVSLTFDQPGSLGIEFQTQAAPYIICQVHSKGLAGGRGLLSGDRLSTVQGENVDGLRWDQLVSRMLHRPVTITFIRSAKSAAGEDDALLSGFTGSLPFLGNFDLGGHGAPGSISAVTSSLRSGTSSLYSGLIGTVQELHSAKAVTEQSQAHEPVEQSTALVIGHEDVPQASSMNVTLDLPSDDITEVNISKPVAMNTPEDTTEMANHTNNFQSELKICALEESLPGIGLPTSTLKLPLLETGPQSSMCEQDQLTAETNGESQTSVPCAAHKMDEATRSCAALEAKVGLLEKHVEACDLSSAKETLRQEELHVAEASLTAAQEKSQHDQITTQKTLDQLHFALAAKDEQIQQQNIALTLKQDEIKSLLRQLARVPGVEAMGAGAVPESEAPVATAFDVMFALEGPLGLEFERLSAPYVVLQVHMSGVAVGLGISPGDELITVAGEPVAELAWKELGNRLIKRPVVARFRRSQNSKESGFISSVSSVGNSLLSAARSAVPVKTCDSQDGRLQAEVERLGTLLRARDAELVEAGDKLKQRDEALKRLGERDAGTADFARLAQEREAFAHQLMELQDRFLQSERQVMEISAERDTALERNMDEVRQADEHKREAATCAERYNSLVVQFESLRATYQNVSLDAQEKAGLASQTRELLNANNQLKRAHDDLCIETEMLREQAAEVGRLRAEVAKFGNYQGLCQELQTRLGEAERSFSLLDAEAVQLREGRKSDQEVICRLQDTVESIQDSGESNVGQLESLLLDRSRECQALRRERDDALRQVDELAQREKLQPNGDEDTHALREENRKLEHHLAVAEEEKRNLNSVVERCVAKLERDAHERPHLVDKRMVTQMLAAYLGNQKNQQEIIVKMADLLGFTTAEREQIGLVQRRRSLLEQQEPGGLTDLFVDFLESEAT